ncbi:hypothetical protein Fcan01_24340 [Folsomia candida]|uniref:Ricin B lectin domain-containing protein n=1 Tax=Folsomia candida TaxID=158441 RepID=A0A226D9X9_FOLCA|nr:hypothetical protein Fcan01_24340 [Folsomia candida]
MIYLTLSICFISLCFLGLVRPQISLGTPVKITNYGSGNALSSQSYPAVWAFKAKGSANFAWVYNSDGTITNYDSSTTGGTRGCLTDPYGGQYIYLEPCNATNSFRSWELVKSKRNGIYQLKNFGSHTCLSNDVKWIVKKQDCRNADDGPHIYQQWSKISAVPRAGELTMKPLRSDVAAGSGD